MIRRAGFVVTVVVTALITLSTAAMAADPAPPPSPNAGVNQGGLLNLNLLNNLAVCPDLTAVLGNVLGILGLGMRDPQTSGGTVVCIIGNSQKGG